MDLLAPWKRCLQCLPVFASEPPPPPPPPPPASKAAPLHAAASAEKSEFDPQGPEKPSFSDASLTHDARNHDLPLSDFAKDVGPLDYIPAETNSVTKDGEAGRVDHDMDSAQAPQDVASTTTGPLPPSSTHAPPTPVGLGSILGQQRPSHHIHHQVNSHHGKEHSFFHNHGHADKAPPRHPISDSMSNDAHIDPPVLSSQYDGDAGIDEEEPCPHTHHQHTHAQNNGFHAPSHPQSITSHVQGLQTSSTLEPVMEKSHSTPAHVDGPASGPHGAYEDEDMAMDGSSTSTLETSQTEPILGVGSPRVRRRDQLKHQLRDLRSQLKQGGYHLKQEGSKHLQTMRSVLNKQAQQD